MCSHHLWFSAEETGLPVAKQIVPKSEVYAGIQALRFAPRKTPLILVSDNEYFVSTAQ